MRRRQSRDRLGDDAFPPPRAGVQHSAQLCFAGTGRREPDALRSTDSNGRAQIGMVFAPPNEEVHDVYVRVVRFTDVSPDRIEGALARINESDGPPPGVSSTRLQMLVDAEQGTAVVLQHFDTAEDMAAAARVFDAMDASETPGARASVDTCEVKLDITP
jgi:hypothetical protein